MNRLDYLSNKFNVTPEEELTTLYNKFVESDMDINVVNYLWDAEPKILVIYYDELINIKRGKVKRHYYFSEYLFKLFSNADPTKQNMYTQWIINVGLKLIEKEEEFIRLVFEDLDTVKSDLVLFDNNKRKKTFISATKSNYALKGIKDPTNINEYKSFIDLFNGVYQFKGVVHPGELYQTLLHTVKTGHGLMPVSDDKFTVFIPLTKQVSELFSFTRWCTARKGGSNFKTYVDNRKWVNGQKSKLVIFIKNEIFGKDVIEDGIYQLNVESNQFMDIHDHIYNGFKNDFLTQSNAILNFMEEYLREGYMHSGHYSSNYLRYIKEFGFGDILLDVLPKNKLAISFKHINFLNGLDFHGFDYLESLYIDDCSVQELPDNLFKLKKLSLVALPNNKITKIPSSIKHANRLTLLNLKGNPITEVSEDIKYLDETNGGNLKRLSICSLTSEDAVNQLKVLLPSTKINIL
jgi:Leucine-rich repeat (LRR) protein